MGNYACNCIRNESFKTSTIEEIDQAPSRNYKQFEQPYYDLSPQVTQSYPEESQIILQSVVRGFLTRLKTNDALHTKRKIRDEQQSRLDLLKPENRYTVITSNLREIFKSGVKQDFDELYGKVDLSLPLDDGVSTEVKPAFIIENDTIYKGEWDDTGCRHGRGHEVLADKTQYIGYFKKGLREGFGRLIYPNSDMYEGSFKRGKPHGKGTLRLETGDLYEGEIKSGLKRGFGKETLRNGDVFEGQFFENKRNGHGVLKLHNGDVIEGEFKNGLIEGKGVLTSPRGFSYVGDWKEGKMHGQGTYNHNDDCYNGGFRNDLKHGFGVYKFANGKVYEGNWKDGRQDGEGLLKFENTCKRGIWKYGKNVKWLQV